MSYFNYKINEFLIESYDGSSVIDVTQCVASIQYYEDLFSPSIFVSVVLVNTDGILSSLTNTKSDMQPGIKGGERVSLKIEQPDTGQFIQLEETKNTYYIYKVYNSTTESTREAMVIELCPAEVFSNETSRVDRKYTGNIKDSVEKILSEVLATTNYKTENIEKTSNNYVFYGNTKRPFTVLTWLCPKAIPEKSSSNPEQGTAGFLFYQNKNGFNFRSMDSLLSAFKVGTSDKKSITKYSYAPTIDKEADSKSNFKILSIPVFEKNVNIMENLRIGMYSSVNYFFDINDRTFYTYNYTLKDSYSLMDHSSKSNVTPPVPLGLDSKEHPSRLMVRILDNFNSDPANIESTAAVINKDETTLYQAASLARYNLAFSQKLSITVPLNLNLTVGDVVQLDFGSITKDQATQGTKDTQKSGYYLIKELSHLFEKNQGYTGLKLIRDSYGEPPE